MAVLIHGLASLMLIGLLCLEQCQADPIPCPSDLEASLIAAFESCSKEMENLQAKPLLGLANVTIGLLRGSPLIERLLPLSDHLVDETRVRRSVNVSLLRGSPLVERLLPLSDHLRSDELVDEIRVRRSINVSLLKEAAPGEKHLSPDEKHLPSEEKHLVDKARRGILNASLLNEAAHEEKHLDEKFKGGHHKRDIQQDDLEQEVGELVVCAVEKLMKEQPVLKKAIDDCSSIGNGADDKKAQKAFDDCVGARVREMCPNLKLN